MEFGTDALRNTPELQKRLLRKEIRKKDKQANPFSGFVSFIRIAISIATIAASFLLGPKGQVVLNVGELIFNPLLSKFAGERISPLNTSIEVASLGFAIKNYKKFQRLTNLNIDNIARFGNKTIENIDKASLQANELLDYSFQLNILGRRNFNFIEKKYRKSITEGFENIEYQGLSKEIAKVIKYANTELPQTIAKNLDIISSHFKDVDVLSQSYKVQRLVKDFQLGNIRSVDVFLEKLEYLEKEGRKVAAINRRIKSSFDTKRFKTHLYELKKIKTIQEKFKGRSKIGDLDLISASISYKDINFSKSKDEFVKIQKIFNERNAFFKKDILDLLEKISQKKGGAYLTSENFIRAVGKTSERQQNIIRTFFNTSQNARSFIRKSFQRTFFPNNSIRQVAGFSNLIKRDQEVILAINNAIRYRPNSKAEVDNLLLFAKRSLSDKSYEFYRKEVNKVIFSQVNRVENIKRKSLSFRRSERFLGIDNIEEGQYDEINEIRKRAYFAKTPGQKFVDSRGRTIYSDKIVRVFRFGSSEKWNDIVQGTSSLFNAPDAGRNIAELLYKKAKRSIDNVFDKYLKTLDAKTKEELRAIEKIVEANKIRAQTRTVKQLSNAKNVFGDKKGFDNVYGVKRVAKDKKGNYITNLINNSNPHLYIQKSITFDRSLGYLRKQFIKTGGVVIPSTYLLGYKILDKNETANSSLIGGQLVKRMCMMSFNPITTNSQTGKNRGGKPPHIFWATDDELQELNERGSEYWWEDANRRKGWWVNRGGRKAKTFASKHFQGSYFLNFIPINALRRSLSLVSNAFNVIGDENATPIWRAFNKRYIQEVGDSFARIGFNRSLRLAGVGIGQKAIRVAAITKASKKGISKTNFLIKNRRKFLILRTFTQKTASASTFTLNLKRRKDGFGINSKDFGGRFTKRFFKNSIPTFGRTIVKKKLERRGDFLYRDKVSILRKSGQVRRIYSAFTPNKSSFGSLRKIGL